MLLMMFLIGLFSGVITGLLSVGGAIILVYLLIFLPSFILSEQLSMQSIAGLAIMQGLFSALSGSLYYVRSKLINREVVLYLGVSAFFGGMLGVYLSYDFNEFVLKVIFTILSVIATVTMFLPLKQTNNQPFQYSIFSSVAAVLGGLIIGVLGGLIGISNGFIFVPVMMYIFRIPVKKAIGSSLITCFLLSLGSLIAKLGVGDLPFSLGIVLILGGVIGAQIGGKINSLLPSPVLKKTAAFAILLISINLFYDLFQK